MNLTGNSMLNERNFAEMSQNLTGKNSMTILPTIGTFWFRTLAPKIIPGCNFETEFFFQKVQNEVSVFFGAKVGN